MAYDPDQNGMAGQPIDQMNVDELMKMQLATMRQQIEPAAVDLGGADFSGMVNYSIAVSLKRIAETMINDNNQRHQTINCLNSLCSQVFDLAKTLSSEMAATRAAIYGISTEVRNNDRDLRITIGKD